MCYLPFATGAKFTTFYSLLLFPFLSYHKFAPISVNQFPPTFGPLWLLDSLVIGPQCEFLQGDL
jgi:hypothetical protein